MELINYLGLVVLTFIGFIAGLALPIFKSIKEELKLGKKYFINFRNVSAALVFGTVFYYETTILSAFTVTIILSVVFHKLKTLKPVVFYLLFTLAIVYSQPNKELLSVVAGIIFLTGLPLGTLQYIDNKKDLVKKTAVVGVLYLVLNFALFFFFLS